MVLSKAAQDVINAMRKGAILKKNRQRATLNDNTISGKVFEELQLADAIKASYKVNNFTSLYILIED